MSAVAHPVKNYDCDWIREWNNALLHALDVDKNGAIDENLISAKGVWGDEAPPQT